MTQWEFLVYAWLEEEYPPNNGTPNVLLLEQKKKLLENSFSGSEFYLCIRITSAMLK